MAATIAIKTTSTGPARRSSAAEALDGHERAFFGAREPRLAGEPCTQQCRDDVTQPDIHIRLRRRSSPPLLQGTPRRSEESRPPQASWRGPPHPPLLAEAVALRYRQRRVFRPHAGLPASDALS